MHIKAAAAAAMEKLLLEDTTEERLFMAGCRLIEVFATQESTTQHVASFVNGVAERRDVLLA